MWLGERRPCACGDFLGEVLVFDWAGAGLGELEEAGLQKRKRGLLPVVVGERVALRLALGQGRHLWLGER